VPYFINWQHRFIEKQDDFSSATFFFGAVAGPAMHKTTSLPILLTLHKKIIQSCQDRQHNKRLIFFLDERHFMFLKIELYLLLFGKKILRYTIFILLAMACLYQKKFLKNYPTYFYFYKARYLSNYFYNYLKSFL
jgi:hypothetical protein